MKKSIALLLVVIMALGLFAACGKTPVETTPKDTTPKDTTPSTTAPKDTTPATTQPAELDTDWIWEDKTLSGEITFAIPFKGNQGMDAMIAEFNESYPNIKVNLHTYSNSSDGNIAVNTAIVNGIVDVIASFGLANTYKRWENGLLLDITDMVEDEGIDLVANWGTDVYKYEDSIYTFPCGGLSNYVAINMTAWKAAGLDKVYNGLPTEWTWDEYLEASKKMTEYDDKGNVTVYGGSDCQSTNYFMYTLCQLTGGDMYYDEDGTSSYDNPRVLASLQRELKAELEDKIWFPKAVYRADGYGANEALCNHYANSIITTNVIRFLHNKESFPDVNWITGFAPYPVESKDEINYMSGVSTFSHAGIAANCEDVDVAWAFLKWYSTYGVKYLAVAGHQPKWTGTEAGSAINLIYGSEEEAAKWVDVESFNYVIGRTDLPAYVETNLTALTDVSGALSEPIMDAINGEISAEECLKRAQEEADEAISKAQD